ncbi:hypothetical protein IWQ62_000569 [Dispira parvispora]|uniref:m7GpppX diphosphatase n=1 Tax=Dispira parvispora TaxID=1520584 RepID=A0A9W8EA12_9FUNG|nr:hypothetical protein IWQ62_000569 [Dispira parvispora]
MAADNTTQLIQRFQFQRVLNQGKFKRLETHPRVKCVYLLGTIHDADTNVPVDAVLKMEKTPFSEHGLGQVLHERLSQVQLVDRNDAYHWLTGWLTTVSNPTQSEPVGTVAPDVKMELIWPATRLHIAKYSFQPREMFQETPDLYQSRVLPYIQSIPTSRLQWVYNILEGVSEQDKVLYRAKEPSGAGFVILPDSKWDRITMENLYLLVLCEQRDIRSLRDLDQRHLPLLSNIQQTIAQVVQREYPTVRPEELRTFIHYQPSYYHFHIHVAHVRYEAAGVMAGQAHLLSTVIDNIKNIRSDYYRVCTLDYTVARNTPFYQQVLSQEES